MEFTSMRPIEQVHRQILAGNVLDTTGRWVPRTEALKQKRAQMKHVLSGEVEIDGVWVKLSSITIKHPKPIEISKERYSVGTDRFSAIRQHISQTTASTEKSISPFANSDSSSPPSPPEKNHQHENDNDKKFASSKIEDTHHENEPTDNPLTAEKQTITIKSIPLGKESVLTISESRAGNALVAICSIQGFIDQTNADDLNAQLMSMLEFGVKFFIIDFEHTNLIGSAGWGVLAIAARLIKAADGHLLICSMGAEIEENYMLLQFNEVIEARKDISECLDTIDTYLTEQKNTITDNDHEAGIFPFYGESFEDLPLHEKIKTIISRNGPVGLFALLKLLKSPQYGNTKIGFIRFFMTLRELNLESKWKRVRFYRSC